MGKRTLQEAAVLVGILWREDQELRVVLVRRAEGGIHGLQLAFAAWQRELEDASPLATALREAREEVGLTADQIQVVAALPVVQTRTTGFEIHPFLARITPPSGWSWQEEEISGVLEPTVLSLVEGQRQETLYFPTWPMPKPTAVYRVGQERVWGVTYRILHPLLPRLLNREWAI